LHTRKDGSDEEMPPCPSVQYDGATDDTKPPRRQRPNLRQGLPDDGQGEMAMRLASPPGGSRSQAGRSRDLCSRARRSEKRVGGHGINAAQTAHVSLTALVALGLCGQASIDRTRDSPSPCGQGRSGLRSGRSALTASWASTTSPAMAGNRAAPGLAAALRIGAGLARLPSRACKGWRGATNRGSRCAQSSATISDRLVC
jgi:hypothetical protein